MIVNCQDCWRVPKRLLCQVKRISASHPWKPTPAVDLSWHMRLAAHWISQIDGVTGVLFDEQTPEGSVRRFVNPITWILIPAVFVRKHYGLIPKYFVERLLALYLTFFLQ